MFITEYVLLIDYFAHISLLRYVHNYIFHWTFCECNNQSFDDVFEFMLWIISRSKKIRSFVYAEYVFRSWERGFYVCGWYYVAEAQSSKQGEAPFCIFFFFRSARTTDKRRNFKRLIQQFITTKHFLRLTLLISFIFPNAVSQMFTQLLPWALKLVHSRQETLQMSNRNVNNSNQKVQKT